MALTFDPAKSERNYARRGLSFAEVEDFDWRHALLGVSRVQNFDTATRYFAIGELRGHICTLIFAFEREGIRVISLRRSSSKERSRWLAARTHI